MPLISGEMPVIIRWEGGTWMCTAIKWEESDAANYREKEVKVH